MAAIKSPHAKQFQKGNVPWNKGIHVENAGTYKKGHEGLKGSLNPRYKGGSLTTQGYWQITVDGKRVLQHRHVVETFRGRKLATNDHVHHKNYDKLDNRIENLQVLDNRTHGAESARKRWYGLTKQENYCGV